jgi:HD-like signal output (HDOD) protein
MAEEILERKGAIRARIEQSGNLPTLPTVIVRVMEIVDSPQTTGKQLAKRSPKTWCSLPRC